MPTFAQEVFKYNSMSTYRHVVYMVLDQIKALSGDSTFTEEHVVFLLNNYRKFLLEQKKKQEGESSLSSENEQTICINLEESDSIPGLEYCNDTYLRSQEEVPDIDEDSTITIQMADQFDIRTAFVTKNRFKFVGHNKYMRNILYCTLGDDKHLYFKSNNPSFMYMADSEDPIKVTAVFEDSEKAAALSCETDDEGNSCEMLDQKFPLEADLLPQCIELVVKELYGAEWRQTDNKNNSNDDLADLVNYIRQQTKSDLARRLS